LNRNWVHALFALGHCKLYTGSIEEAIPLVEQAIRLSPRDPQLGIWYLHIGRAHLLQSRTDEAIIWLERARNATPAYSGIRAWLASAYALKGEAESAAAELAEARRLNSDGRFSSIARLKTAGYFPAPKIRTCSKPLISSACGWPGCRKNDRDASSRRDPRRRCGGLLAPDGCG
jgi:tetratricopeptide (TPR) repeat protein